MYRGATRARTVDVSVDGVVTTWTSSGTTVDFESIDLSGQSGQEITVTGVLAELEWISIVEVSSMERLALRKTKGQEESSSELGPRRCLMVYPFPRYPGY